MKAIFISILGKRFCRSAFFVLLISGSFKAHASHMAGAQLEYTFIGSDSYKVTYTLFTDCSGSLPPSSVNLTIRSNQCNYNLFTTLSFVPGTDLIISNNCSTSLSACNGGMNAGFKQNVYSGIVNITNHCDDFIFSVTDCCRNGAISTINNPEIQPLYVEAFLNNTSSENNSPIFDSKPILFLNSNQTNQLSINANDVDGDSLVYSLITPKTSEINNVIFLNGYSKDQFISTEQPIQFDSRHGMLTITPNALQTGVFAVKIQEYRSGHLIGSIMRDIQLIVVNSLNHLPSIIELENSNSTIKYACAGQLFQIDLSTFDLDQSQQTSIEVNSNIAELNISKTSELHQKAILKWTPSLADVSNGYHWIRIVVSDNACPTFGTTTYFMELKVSSLSIEATTTNSTCPGIDNGSIFIQPNSSNSIAVFTWSDSNTDQMIRTMLPAGAYAVSIDNQQGCSINNTYQISNIHTINSKRSTTNADCGINNGAAEITIEGGTAPYELQWSDGGSSQNRSDLKPGQYTFVIRDQEGCSVHEELTIESNVCEELPTGFVLYPNPAQDQITIQNFNAGNYPERLEIIDGNGRIIYQEGFTSTSLVDKKIELSTFSAGVYFARITTDNESSILPFLKQ